MKKRWLFLPLVIVFLLFACKKITDKPVDNRPLQLVKKIMRYEGPNGLKTDSTGYTYDAQGHLLMITNLHGNLPVQSFTYSGDELTSVVSYQINGAAGDTVYHPASYADNGNTIVLDFTRPNPTSGTDTVLITYKWSGDELLEAWTYVHNAGQDFIFQKTLLTYDSHGNQVLDETEFGVGKPYHSVQPQSNGLAYDQQKNFFRTTSRLNYIFMGWGFPYATRSVNNPTRGGAPNAPVDYVWTYNADGYPLTMTVKDSAYAAVELVYNK